MSFNEVPADAYDRFMGRYSVLIGPQFIDFAGISRAGVSWAEGARAEGAQTKILDVGCGTGALLAELVTRFDPASLTAIDPSPPFVQAVRERYPLVEAHEASAESLPFKDGTFDATLSQLVVQFLPDPVAGLREMQRVTRSGGVVAATVWDFEGRSSPLSTFWQVARELDPRLRDEALQPGARKEDLRELFQLAGLSGIVDGALEASMEYNNFDEWWDPYTGGVGPAGRYLASLDSDHQSKLRERCKALLPSAGFSVAVRAWAMRGTAMRGTAVKIDSPS